MNIQRIIVLKESQVPWPAMFITTTQINLTIIIIFVRQLV